MTIETKYNIGDEVYYKRFGEIYKLRILGVQVVKKASISFVLYYVVRDADNILMLMVEQHLSPTKEELLNSL